VAKKTNKKKELRRNNICPVCGASIKMVPVSEMNFRQMHNKSAANYWVCSKYPACDTYIPADPYSKKPYGLMAGPMLRHKRILIHRWEVLFISNQIMDSPSFRQSCGYSIGIHNHHCFHTRELTEMQCDTVLKVCDGIYKRHPELKDKIPEGGALWKYINHINPTAKDIEDEAAKENEENAEDEAKEN
jgi:hypothetical protein